MNQIPQKLTGKPCATNAMGMVRAEGGGSMAHGILAELQGYITDLVLRGGPEPHEYRNLDECIAALASAIEGSAQQADAWKKFWGSLCRGSCAGTLYADTWMKRNGYAGDFEMIDHIYLKRVSGNTHCRRWDEHYQAQAATEAVRNRKSYLLSLLASHRASHPDSCLNVLNVASGPCRDVWEWFSTNGPDSVTFDCVEMDGRAVSFAKNLNEQWGALVHFHEINALRFRTERRFKLVWSAGLFDYLNDALFVRLLRRLMGFVAPSGEVVIGNFADGNPTRNIMQLLGDWHLIHRSPEMLRQLASQAGAGSEDISIGAEPAGINLFLHIRTRG